MRLTGRLNKGREKGYLRLELLFEPNDRLLGLNVDVEGAEHAVFARVHIRVQLQACHVDRDADPVKTVHIDIVKVAFVLTANFLQVKREVCPQFAHIELEIAHLGQLVHLLYEQHRIVLTRRHQQIVIRETHQTVQLDVFRITRCVLLLFSATVDNHSVSSALFRVLHHRSVFACGGGLPCQCRRQSFLSEEFKLAVLQVRVVETRQDVADAQALRDALGLLVLLLVERDVVVLRDVLQRLE